MHTLMFSLQHTNFHALFAEVADLASIKSDNLVVCYEGKRVFPSSNPHSIGIWAEAELGMYDVHSGRVQIQTLIVELQRPMTK